jgi:hypothetical protein
VEGCQTGCRDGDSPDLRTAACERSADRQTVLNQGRIIELAAPQGLLTMYGWRDFANEGRLMSDDPTWFDPATLRSTGCRDPAVTAISHQRSSLCLGL